MSKKFKWEDLLQFEEMLFPKIATVIYLVLGGISVLAGFVMFIIGLVGMGRVREAMIGLATMIIAPFLIRLWFEFMLVLFKIHDKLGDIRGELTQSKGVYTNDQVGAERLPPHTTGESKQMICSNCGQKFTGKEAFCGNCGSKL